MKSKIGFMAVALLACMALVGCATTDFNGELAKGYQSVTAVRATTLTALKADVIAAKDAQNVQNLADDARTALDIARDVHTVTPDLGADKLASAVTVLQSLQKYLGDLLK